jgi:uncharacterized protein (TIGR03083 family)
MATVMSTSVEDVPPIGRAEANALATAEYARFVDLLRGLEPADWDRPTDCTRWTVKDIAAHIVGETEAFASLREFAHQWRRGPRTQREIGGGHVIDGVNEVQVRERRGLPPSELIERLAARAPKATRTRARLPRPLRSVPVTFSPPLGCRSVAYLVDQVITRDVWMHRMDIARATGAARVLTAEHDGRLVADMVAEWATTHPDQFVLELTGPAGGTYRRTHPPDESATLTRLDAVEFVRIVSGRAPGDGLLAHPLPL